jgi:HD-like signal output (HDOD) protein
MRPKESFLEIIMEHLDSDETVLPIFDASVQRIQKEAAEKDPDLRTIEMLIGRDPALTGQVLKAANSAFYEGLTTVSTIHNAIIRLGTGELSLLLLQQDDVGFLDSFCDNLVKNLWRHSMGCAIGAQWIAKQCRFDTLAQEAYIAGLLHDVGKLLLITVVENITRSGKKKLRPSNELLHEVLDNFHAEHGYLLLKRWNLPESFCKVAHEHHYEDVDPNDALLTIVRLANKACNKLGIGLSKDPSIILAAAPEANLLGLSEVFLAELEIILEDAMILQGDSNLNIP